MHQDKTTNNRSLCQESGKKRAQGKSPTSAGRAGRRPHEIVPPSPHALHAARRLRDRRGPVYALADLFAYELDVLVVVVGPGGRGGEGAGPRRIPT